VFEFESLLFESLADSDADFKDTVERLEKPGTANITTVLVRNGCDYTLREEELLSLKLGYQIIFAFGVFRENSVNDQKVNFPSQQRFYRIGMIKWLVASKCAKEPIAPQRASTD